MWVVTHVIYQRLSKMQPCTTATQSNRSNASVGTSAPQLSKHELEPCSCLLVITSKGYCFNLFHLLFPLPHPLWTHSMFASNTHIPIAKLCYPYSLEMLSHWLRLACRWLRWNLVGGPTHSLRKTSWSLHVRAGHRIEKEQRVEGRGD